MWRMTPTPIAFVGSIPDLYDRHLGPVLFEPYARDLAARLPSGARRVLEIAAGTGRVTRQLLAHLPIAGELVATDLSPPMLERAAQLTGPDARLSWRQADAQALPVADHTFDVVACQFGLMFVPDKALALREMHRALAPGGTLLLSTWDSIARNPATTLLHELATAATPHDPPLFMLTPFSMDDAGALASLIRAAGFRDVRVDTVVLTGESVSASDFAVGLVRGNPLWHQLMERGIDAEVFERKVSEALIARFGDEPCRTSLSAHVVTAIA